MNLRGHGISLLTVCMLVSVPQSTAAAQQAAPPITADTTGRQADVFTRHDAIAGATFALGVAAIMPFDRHLAVESQRPALQNSAPLRHAATTFRLLGEPGAIILAAASYAYGRTEDSPRSAELGLRTLESIGAAGITSFIIKGMAGRARPFVSSDTNPHDYKLGRGFRDDDHTSFPSGHVTTAFAAASAVSQEISYLWPNASHLWTPLLFTSASLVGVSRIYDDKHWTSDVIAGAAVGTLVSRAVVRLSRAHPGNHVDRWLLPTGVSPSSGTRPMSVVWNYRW